MVSWVSALDFWIYILSTQRRENKSKGNRKTNLGGVIKFVKSTKINNKIRKQVVSQLII